MNIAIFVNHPKCSIQSVNGIIRSLPDHKFKIFTKHCVEDNFFSDVDLVCFPGGLGDSDSFDTVLKHNKHHIKEFVARGKPYLGICMGAYWADKLYFDILDKTRVVQYIKQPNTCTKRPHAKLIDVIWSGEKEQMFFYDGCTYLEGDFSIVAFYLKTLYPMAIIQDNVGLIGCHPEADQHWFNSYSYTKDFWHGGRQYQLLNKFVERLLK